MEARMLVGATQGASIFMMVNSYGSRCVDLVRAGNDYWSGKLNKVRDEPARDWIPPPIEWSRATPNDPASDFPSFWTSIWCVSARAMTAIGACLNGAGEILRLEGLDDQYVGFHCLHVVDAVDKVATDACLAARNGVALASPRFVPTLFASALTGDDVFRVRESFQKVFVSSRFKDAYERAGLTGLDFLPVPLS